MSESRKLAKGWEAVPMGTEIICGTCIVPREANAPAKWVNARCWSYCTPCAESRGAFVVEPEPVKEHVYADGTTWREPRDMTGYVVWAAVAKLPDYSPGTRLAHLEPRWRADRDYVIAVDYGTD